ncbi:MAG: bifunctional protein PyrR [Lysobacterales bacterium]|jgi:pyrimidine operon attenuation protein/uracil phosphoribosyltransferase|nr:MAG: bifunctional protein PyrR [Xanthomonadales bacterium]
MAGEPLIPPTDAALERLAGSLCTVLNERARSEPVLAGIRRGGVWVAERLKSALSLSEPLGEIDFGMFRDDLGRISPARPLSASRLPWDVEGRHVVLVDDVLATGRTVRAALEELFQFGRPASVTLAILVERAEPGLRELPIAPDAVGFRLCFGRARTLKLRGPDPLFFELLGDASQ